MSTVGHHPAGQVLEPTLILSAAQVADRERILERQLIIRQAARIRHLELALAVARAGAR